MEVRWEPLVAAVGQSWEIGKSPILGDAGMVCNRIGVYGGSPRVEVTAGERRAGRWEARGDLWNGRLDGLGVAWADLEGDGSTGAGLVPVGMNRRRMRPAAVVTMCIGGRSSSKL